MTLPSATAGAQVVPPVASRSQVAASVSTTLGGVPRVCRGPGTSWTATCGGTRSSTDRPGTCWASQRALVFTARPPGPWGAQPGARPLPRGADDGARRLLRLPGQPRPDGRDGGDQLLGGDR